MDKALSIGSSWIAAEKQDLPIVVSLIYDSEDLTQHASDNLRVGLDGSQDNGGTESKSRVFSPEILAMDRQLLNKIKSKGWKHVGNSNG